MALIVLRAVVLLVAAGVGLMVVNSPLLSGASTSVTLLAFASFIILALLVIALDAAIPRKRIDIVSAVYFGLIVGLFLTYIAGIALEPLTQSIGARLFEGIQQSNQYRSALMGVVQLTVGLILCYLCISLLIQTKDDFRFIIPYVEFAKDVKGLKPYLLDTSVVIDGRIADLVETCVFESQLIMPRFVLTELQGIADSSDRLRRSRGRRGLDILNRLRNSEHVDLKIVETELPEMANQPVDMKLVLLAKHLQGRIITGDYNLHKIARLHNVDVINLNDVANALKPIFLPGEQVEVRIVKQGEEEGQGVGYLDDGTMIVVEGGRDHVNETVRIAVTSVLQTSAGRMIFGRYNGRAGGTARGESRDPAGRREG